MEPAGSFQYQPAFELDGASADELLEFEDIRGITDSKEICRTIIDYQFEDEEAQVIYGEIGDADKTAKFFVRTLFGEGSELEEAKIYVPEDQEKYPTANEFFYGINAEEESEAAGKASRVEDIAYNFKTGTIMILDAQQLKEQAELEEEQQ